MGDFNRVDSIRRLRTPRIAVLSAGFYEELLRETLPGAEVVVLDDPADFFERGDRDGIDALALSAEKGSAWSLLFPGYSVAIPRPEATRQPLAYPVPQDAQQLADFLNVLIRIGQTDGTIDRLYEHWILGRSPETRQPRWSVIRDVLGWVE